jgi:Putative DNA-binding domain
MSAPKPHLEQIQRWMQSVITHKGGVEEALGSADVRRHLDVSAEGLEEVICRSRSLSGAERLEIYVDAYYARLMECLEGEFAATRYAVGDALFAALAFGYLQSYPSRSYTLGQLGGSFPGYLGESRLHAGAAPEGSPASWADFVIELAAFERLLYEVFDGEGTERGGTLQAAELAQIPLERWDGMRLRPAPCLRVRQFEHPIHEYWTAWKDECQPDACRPRATRLAIHRRDYVVEHHELSGGQFAMLAQIVGGASLARAIGRAVASVGPDEEPLEPRLGKTFACWAEAGYFVGAESVTEAP